MQQTKILTGVIFAEVMLYCFYFVLVCLSFCPCLLSFLHFFKFKWLIFKVIKTTKKIPPTCS